MVLFNGVAHVALTKNTVILYSIVSRVAQKINKKSTVLTIPSYD